MHSLEQLGNLRANLDRLIRYSAGASGCEKITILHPISFELWAETEKRTDDMGCV